jgi:hypothetical protein
MNYSAEVWLVLLSALVLANLPFVNERLFVVGPRREPKSLGWRLVELLVFGLVALGIGLALEARIGRVHAQGWEFYVAALSLYLTFAFPGYVLRYLRRSGP